LVHSWSSVAKDVRFGGLTSQEGNGLYLITL
jgi:hypothetical protein